MVKFLSWCARPPPSPPRQIPSQMHFPTRRSRGSADFFTPPATLAWSELKAGAASWALQAHVSPAADGACDLVLGKVAGSAFRAGESGRTAVFVAPQARLCAPLGIGLDPMAGIW